VRPLACGERERLALETEAKICFPETNEPVSARLSHRRDGPDARCTRTPAREPMSTAPPPPAPTHAQDEVEIRIISHSTLFYWWPVWAIGFIMTLLTYIDGHHMAIVPKDSQIVHTVKVADEERDAIVLPSKAKLGEDALKLHVAQSKSYGVIFATILLLVIVITNVPLRGMWSVVVIVVIIMGIVIISLIPGLWDKILNALFMLHIHMNAAGYLFISLLLLAVWLVTFIFFDQQIYMIFTPGQVKVRTEIGGGEVAYDTTGMTIQKQRSDLFRHWILGLGSGDLLVTTTGAASHHFDLPNVLFIGKKVQQIEDMLREKAVVRGR
jgi:hypothetical protein